MLQTVTFTDFRKNLPKYFEKLKKNENIKVTDGRSGKEIITLEAKKSEEFDWDEHIKKLKNMKPFLTDKGVKSMQKFRDDVDKRFESARIR